MIINDKEVLDYLMQKVSDSPDNKYRKGSRLRLLKMTHGSRKQVVDQVNPLIKGFAEIAENDYWMPRGANRPQRSKTGQDNWLYFIKS